MVDTNIQKLQSAAHEIYGCDLQGAMQKATGLFFMDWYGICERLYNLPPNLLNDQLTNILTTHGLLLDGGGWASTPDDVSLDLTADIDFRLEGQDFGAFSGSQGEQLANRGLFCKWSPTTQQSYILSMIPLFTDIRFTSSTTGANSIATDQVVTADQLAAWRSAAARRFTLDADNGAAGRTVTFYTSDSIAGTWTQIATATTATALAAFFNSTAALVLGASSAAGAEPYYGRITRMELRNGIGGTVVANPDFRNLSPGTTSFVDGAGKTWTLQGTAKIV